MTFVFDENISHRIVEGFKAFGEDVVHIAEVVGRGKEDPFWIPEIGKRELILITNDYRILKKPHEAKAIRDASVSAFFIDITTHPDLWGWIEFFIKRWRDIRRLAENTPRPFAFRVTMRSIKQIRFY